MNLRQFSQRHKSVALSLLPGMGGATFRKLIERYEHLDAIFEAPAGELKAVAGPRGADFSLLNAQALFDRADREMQTVMKRSASLVTYFDEAYPPLLRQIYDPPLVLYYRGSLPGADTACAAIVGSRNASAYGIRMARQIAGDLSRAGVTVVSGLALGIDSAAHEAVVEAGGSTIAVMGSGLSWIYPETNAGLFDRIIQNGCVMTEYPMDAPPVSTHFPVRNRIISGLSRAVVVVEAMQKSGALITVEAALEQNREVFAVPGNADSKRSVGPNRLIQQGAKPVFSADDILEALSLTRPSGIAAGEAGAAARAVDNLNDLEARILNVLEDQGAFMDEIAEQAGCAVSETAQALSALEIKGYVRKNAGNLFERS